MKRLAADSMLFRSRGSIDSGKVSFIELFFDLIFVFAVTQLSHSFLKNFTLEGAIHLGILTMAVWWVWIFSAWVMNWLNPETRRVRFMLIALMLVGLIMSSSLPEAFEKTGIYFACAYTLFQVGRTAYTIWVLQHGSTELRINFIRILSWLAFAGVFWIAGGIAHEENRLALWCIALLIEYLSPSLGFWTPKLGKTPTTVWDVEGSHMAERCGLFMIIALGESILVTGATFAELEWDMLTLGSFAAAFVSTVAMWWIYFNMTAKTGHHFIAHSEDPGRIARSAYTYTHLLLVAGIILSAVADELVLAHPTGHIELKTALVIMAGPALYLLGNMLFMRIAAGVVSAPYTVGIIVLVALFLLYSFIPPLFLSVLATLTLVGVAVWGSVFTDRLCQAPLPGQHKTEKH
ncbi:MULTISPECIES: low temperature requirement protein A [unclassified Paenibacillus]|uniref:low temperature requirement protein A n=1 Tax=unclassified Paenibacillus TaxID=185978 RepID=UPI001053707C|nr:MULTISPECIES: low temperature requirement protein A [unclassified Paenibacillus]NIK70541.1 low temperature requirement protein LtrA [Paenibacillus sp. BK720]TCM91040.1 low temperature requirement protein LtrA [Paenibacillus sp. BK033]